MKIAPNIGQAVKKWGLKSAAYVVPVAPSMRRQNAEALEELKREQRAGNTRKTLDQRRGSRAMGRQLSNDDHRPKNLRRNDERGAKRLGSGGPGRNPGDPKTPNVLKARKKDKKESR